MPGDSKHLLKTREGRKSLSNVLKHVKRGSSAGEEAESIGGVETVIISARRIKRDSQTHPQWCSQTQTACFLQAQTPVRRSHSLELKIRQWKATQLRQQTLLCAGTSDLMLVVSYSARKALFTCEISWLMELLPCDCQEAGLFFGISDVAFRPGKQLRSDKKSENIKIRVSFVHAFLRANLLSMTLNQCRQMCHYEFDHVTTNPRILIISAGSNAANANSITWCRWREVVHGSLFNSTNCLIQEKEAGWSTEFITI